MNKFEKNFHTHTYRCKHASGDIDDYCESALLEGIKVLGFSDHTPLPDNRWPSIRMSMNELNNYSEMIDAAKLKYPQIKLFKGLECEYDPSYESFYRNEILSQMKFDYLIGSVHFIPFRSGWLSVYENIINPALLKIYAEYFIKSMESGLFTFMGHPDVFIGLFPVWNMNTKACVKDMLQAAETLNIPLEINSLGFRKPYVNTKDGMRPMYPLFKFWELAAEYKIKVIINSDAHSPSDLTAELEKTYLFAQKFNFNFFNLDEEIHTYPQKEKK